MIYLVDFDDDGETVGYFLNILTACAAAEKLARDYPGERVAVYSVEQGVIHAEPGLVQTFRFD